MGSSALREGTPIDAVASSHPAVGRRGKGGHPASPMARRNRMADASMAAAGLAGCFLLVVLWITTAPEPARGPQMNDAEVEELQVLLAEADARYNTAKRHSDDSAARWHRILDDVRSAGGQRRGGVIPPYAYSIVISNDDYVDGALVLGLSLGDHSEYMRTGKALMVCVVPKGKVHPKNVERLEANGWQVVQARDVSKELPQGLKYADSFNKLYIFGLTQFQKVVFMDTDMLALASPDEAFDYTLPAPHWIGAIGGKEDYFQTGFMVFQPTRWVYQEIWQWFYADLKKPDGLLRGSKGARDGSFLREYFGPNHRPVHPKYSLHIAAKTETTDGVLMLHFRGPFKPWQDPARKELLDKVTDVQDATFGLPYTLWWQYYDRLHQQEVKALPQAARSHWGPPSSHPDPTTHYWMFRYSSSEYSRPTEAQVLAARNVKRPHTALAAGKAGESCNAVCARRAEEVRHALGEEAGRDEQMFCDEAGLTHLYTSHCAVLQKAFGEDVDGCTYNHFWTDELDIRDLAPYLASGLNGKPKLVMNANLDARRSKKCAAAHVDVRRLCPCVPHKFFTEAVEAWDEDVNSVLIL
eukprot:TRINITY_DN4518_c0_g1_i1.p1 TRINITY_DN4518_c0_g1~~TRINITY_DN4518_c0_g1_i1.p1  ORF type:complete len:582 (+),score=165.14 TRINITY_DN4518_c0_g1_i1:23-1768(+)